MLRPPCRAILYDPEPEPLRGVLARAGCAVTVAAQETEAAEAKATLRPEAVFLHGLPPGAAGRLRRLPPQVETIYCLLVDSRDLTGLDPAGYDDFMVLPVQPAEVAARVRLWRWRGEQISEGLLRAGPLTVDLAHLRVTVAGAPVELTYKEYELLCLLLRRRGQVLTRDSILDTIWGPDYYGGSRTVDVHIRRLRMKLPEIEEQITTVHGIGYRFEG